MFRRGLGHLGEERFRLGFVPPDDPGEGARDFESFIKAAVVLGVVDHVLPEPVVQFGAGQMALGFRPEIIEGALEREPLHVVDGFPAYFDRSAVVDGGEADRAVDDNDAPGVLKQRGQMLVVQVKHPALGPVF